MNAGAWKVVVVRGLQALLRSRRLLLLQAGCQLRQVRGCGRRARHLHIPHPGVRQQLLCCGTLAGDAVEALGQELARRGRKRLRHGGQVFGGRDVVHDGEGVALVCPWGATCKRSGAPTQ